MPWAAIVSFVMSLVGKIFGIGQADDPAAAAHKEGEISGKAQQEAADAQAGLKELQTADRARDAAADAIRTDGVRKPDVDASPRGSDGVS